MKVTSEFSQSCQHGLVFITRTSMLIRLVLASPSARVQAFWSGVASWLNQDRRFARLKTNGRGELLAVGTTFQVNGRGEDERFKGTSLIVPAGALRDRPSDVLSPSVLAQRHRGYRNRLMIGPTWRADVWTVLELSPRLSVAELARQSSASFYRLAGGARLRSASCCQPLAQRLGSFGWLCNIQKW
jgi:hypothetical protein